MKYEITVLMEDHDNVREFVVRLLNGMIIKGVQSFKVKNVNEEVN